MTLRLRPAGEGDIAAIMTVMAAAFDPAFGEAWSATQVLGSLTMPTSWSQLALADAGTGTRPAGFSLCRTIGPEAELLLIGVPPIDRGRGFGAALLSAAKADARSAGVEAIFLEVRDGNAAALALYRSAGFSAVGRRRDYYRGAGASRFDAITLRCALCE